MVKAVQAGGGVVYRIDNEIINILLIYRNRFWDLPKGKLERGESIQMCASREVSEEIGSEIPMQLSDLGTTYHEYTQKGINYGKTTFWFAMILPQITGLIPQQEEGIGQIEWFNLNESIRKVDFDNLKRVLMRFQYWIK